MKKTVLHYKGFSLVELMIAVAIIGILAAIAVPQYESYKIKGTRSAAQQALLQIANRQEQVLMDQRSYFAAADNAAIIAAGIPLSSDVTNFYDVSTTGGNTFTVTAAPKAGTRQEGDGNLVINHLGVKTGKW